MYYLYQDLHFCFYADGKNIDMTLQQNPDRLQYYDVIVGKEVVHTFKMSRFSVSPPPVTLMVEGVECTFVRYGGTWDCAVAGRYLHHKTEPAASVRERFSFPGLLFAASMVAHPFLFGTTVFSLAAMIVGMTAVVGHAFSPFYKDNKTTQGLICFGSAVLVWACQLIFFLLLRLR